MKEVSNNMIKNPRMPLLPMEQMPPKTRQMIEGDGPTNSLNINKMMAHAESCVRHYMRMGSAILSQLQLDPVLRELVVLRVGVLCDSSYQRFQHEKIARQVGVPEEKIQGVANSLDASCFSDLERLVLQYTDEVTTKVRSQDDTFQKLGEHFDHRELAELTLVIGFYNMVSRFLVNMDVMEE